MTVTAILEFHFTSGVLEQARTVVHRVLSETRAFEGNLGVDVLIDLDDESHWSVVELWESLEHDLAYREFRAGPGAIPDLAPLLSTRVLTKYTLDPTI
jgi:quinol monooxygenase YgiN